MSERHYDIALQNLEATLHALAGRVPPPQLAPFGARFVYRYKERTIHQALVQKLARVISGLHAARILLARGFVQELGVLQRTLDELHEDIAFLSFAIIFDDETDLHREYLAAFYEEEFDNPESAVESTQKRPTVKRRRIRAYIANSEGAGLDPSRATEVARTLHSLYSGFVHGASPHIMEMYLGDPPHFHVRGMLGTIRAEHHREDFSNYIYRSVIASAFIAKAFGDEDLFASIVRFKDEFEAFSGKTYARAP